MNKIGGSLITLALGALILGSAPQAHASPIMTMCLSDLAPGSNATCTLGDSILLSSDGVTITATVNGSSSILSDVTGVHNLSGAFDVGAWTFTVATGRVFESPGNYLDLTFNAANGGAAASSLWIQFNYDSFTNGQPFSGIGGTTNDGTTDTFTGCYEPSPGLGGWCSAVGTILGSATYTGAGGHSGFNSPLLPTQNPFGLGIQLEIDAASFGSTSGDLSLTPAPEPISMFLVGGGLLGLGLISRRKKA